MRIVLKLNMKMVFFLFISHYLWWWFKHTDRFTRMLNDVTSNTSKYVSFLKTWSSNALQIYSWIQKYIWQFRQMPFAILTNTSQNLETYSCQFAIWRNTFGNLDKLFFEFGQNYLSILTNIFCNLNIYNFTVYKEPKELSAFVL